MNSAKRMRLVGEKHNKKNMKYEPWQMISQND